MTIRLAMYVGMERVAEVAKRFGVIDDLPKQLAMSIGAGETTLMKMVAGYTPFVNGGKKVVPTFIDRIQDRDGKTIYVHDRRDCDGCGPLMPWKELDNKTPDLPDNREQIADPKLAYQMVSMMEGVVQRGTAQLLKELGRPVAGKTGTTNDSKDVWFVGFTPDLVVGVFVGFDDPRNMGKKETGGKIAAPIFKEFVGKALDGVPPVPFRVPDGVKMVQVNPDTGARASTEGSIWEAYVEGAEPGDEAMVFDGEQIAPASQAGANMGEGATTGLGGLY